MGDLMSIIQMLMGGGRKDDLEQQNQLWRAKTEQLRNEKPWRFKSDSQGYAPDDLMMFKNPGFMDVMTRAENDVTRSANNPTGGQNNGPELDRMILDQMLINLKSRQKLNRGIL